MCAGTFDRIAATGHLQVRADDPSGERITDNADLTTAKLTAALVPAPDPHDPHDPHYAIGWHCRCPPRTTTPSQTGGGLT